jgi:uncharacterized repeat protein (TIGR03803 family)
MKKLIIILCGLCQLILAQNIFAQGELWGMTSTGGSDNKGVIFKTNLDGTGYSVQLSFDATNVGSSPTGTLLQAANGKLYGTTNTGGANDYGTLFEYDQASGILTKKVDIGLIGGKYPKGGLLQASNGKLYGTATRGGTYDRGVLFEYDLSTGIAVKRFDFGRIFPSPSFEVDGYFPNGDLVQAPNGKLYGTTSAGGIFDNQGTLFEFDPITAVHTKRFDFGTRDPTNTSVNSGKFPNAGLVLAFNGFLYGTTPTGGVPTGEFGSSGAGVLFRFDPNASPLSGGYTKIMNFATAAPSTTGSGPRGSLIQAANGKLYGTTNSGGANGDGVIFEYDLSTGTFNKKFDFSGSTSGASPQSGLAQSSNNKLYGITNAGGTNGKGVLFEFDPFNGDFTKKLDFTGLNGDSPGSCGIAFILPPGSKSNQTITFNPLPSKAFGDDPFELTATSPSGLTVTYTSSDLTVATISGNLVTILKPGTVTITASQIGNVTYNAAPSVQQTLTINKGNQTISFDPIPVKMVGDSEFYLPGVSSAILNITYESSDPTIASINLNIVSILKGGTVTITASQAGNEYYNLAVNVQQVLTINKYDQEITFESLSPVAFSSGLLELTGEASSLLPVTYSSSDPTVASISGSTVTLLKAGTITVTASQAGDGYYNPATNVQRLLTINKSDQTIIFPVLPTQTLGDAPFNLNATSSSGLPITYSTTSDKVSIANNKMTLLKAGKANITASQNGSAGYNAAQSVTQNFCVLPTKPTVSLVFVNRYRLISSSAVGNQWYLNGVAIVGATNQSWDVANAGIYKVQVKVEDCLSELSNEFSIDESLIITGDIKNYSITNSIEVFPSPVNDWLTISFGDTQGKKEVSIYQLDGRSKDLQNANGGEAKFDVADYSAGIYIVKVLTDNSVKMLRFIKEQ